MSGDTGSPRHSRKDEAVIKQPLPRMFPRTEGQAKLVVIVILATIFSGIVYLVLRGFGLTQLVSE